MQGEQGLIGPAGPAGAAGAQGIQGAQGPAGSTGAQGPQGPIGATGAQGPAGPAGAAGTNGAPGATGATGPQGPAGPAGPSWTVGTGLSLSGTTLSTDPNYDIHNQGASAQAANFWINGQMRMGSETTSGAAGYAMINRRIFNTSTTAGTIVAVTDDLRIERDGTNGGMQVHTLNTNQVDVQCFLLSSTGAVTGVVKSYSSATTEALFTNGANIVRADCTFGYTYLNYTNTHMVISRRAGDYYWGGFIQSATNQ